MCFINSHKKLNINKKGFSLVELLVSVAIIAVVTPLLVEGFIYASKLNYRSRLQQRVDAAANSVYEGISSVEYEELAHYLSAENGWTALEDVDEKGYAYYVSKKHKLNEGEEGTLDDCEITVAVTKYSESYVVPDLNLIGVNSEYLTLSDEINDADGVIAERIRQHIKTNEEIKKKIKEDIVYNSGGKIKSIDQIKSSDIIIDCGKIDVERISKQTDIELDLIQINNAQNEDGGFENTVYKFVVNYETSYRYPANIANPSLDSSSLKIYYSYAQNHGGKWVSFEKKEIDIGRFVIPASEGEVSVYTLQNEAQNMFIYYNPLSAKDWLNIKSNTNHRHNVFLVEQNTLGVDTLFLGDTIEDVNNNFYFTSVEKPEADRRSPAELQQGHSIINLYSNNENVSKNGIPDSIYESSEKQENLYRVQVTVTYKSSIFAEVSGEFKAGGGTVGNYDVD